MLIARDNTGKEGAILIHADGTVVSSTGSGSMSSQAAAYLARTVGGNEGGNGANIATLIDGLVSDGVWAKLDALYVLAQQNETDAKLNLIGTSYNLTQVGALGKPGPRTGTLVFTPYVGFSGFNPNGSRLDTGFNPTTAPSPHYTLNSASFGYSPYSNIVDGSPQIGVWDAYISLYGHHSSGNVYAYVNVTTTGYVQTVSTITGNGVIAADRPDAANSYVYQNGVRSASSASASTAMYNGAFIVGYVSGGPPPTVQTLSAAFIGASLGSAGQLALYNRLRTYMTAIGVP